MKKILFISLIAVLLINMTFAGELSGSFAPVINNARAGALGEAFITVTDDFSSIYYNPAGLSYVERPNLGFNYLYIPAGFTSVEFLGGATKLFGISIGVGVETKSITSEEELSFPFSENSIKLSIAKEILPKLRVGLSTSLYLATLDTGSATGFGIDVGTIYEINEKIKVGAVWYDPISSIEWSTGTVESSSRQDLLLGVSANLNVINIPVTLAFDVSLYDKPYFYNRLHFGADVNPLPLLSVRVGYNGDKETLSLGFGAKVNFIKLDYAFLYTKALSNQHIITVSASF